MDSDGTLLAELLFGFVHLTNEVNEGLSGLGDSLLWPVRELELADRPGRAVTSVSHLELSQEVLWHVVFGQGIDHEALIPLGPVTRPVLGTLFLKGG